MKLLNPINICRQVVPNVMCVALYSPPLDAIGNSVRGLHFCNVRESTEIEGAVGAELDLSAMFQELVDLFNFHRFDNMRHSSSTKLDPRRQSFEVTSPTFRTVCSRVVLSTKRLIPALHRCVTSLMRKGANVQK